MARTLIRCGWLVTMDDGLGDISRADMLLNGDRIEAIGHDLGITADATIDASDMIVLPGLINMHLHTFQAGLRAIGSEWLAPDYFRNFYGDIATRYSAEDNYLGTLFGALNQLDCGVTTLFDYCHNIRSLDQAERSVDGLADAGIRAVFVHGDGLREPAAPGKLPQRRLHPRDRVLALQKSRFAHDGLISLALGIAGPHWADWEATLHNVRLARDLGLMASSHVTKAHRDAVVPDGYDRLAAMGLLGPDHNLVHCNLLSNDEVGRLLDAGCSITSTNMNELHDYPHGSALTKVVEHGGLPSIGIDVEPMVSGDMWREMQMALLFARNARIRARAAAGQGPAMIRSREALRWATVGGAKALGLADRIGSLRPGHKADLIMLRAGDLNLFPVHDPVFSVVEQAHAGNVDTVIVDGIVRKRGGQLLFDRDRRRLLGERLAESATRLMAEAGYRHAPA